MIEPKGLCVVPPAQAADIQHEPGKPSESLTAENWPIRVGGAYVALGLNHEPSGITRHVTAIHASIVYFEPRHADGELAWSPSFLSAPVFRACSLPEDQSPLPSLYSLLERCREQFSRPGVDLGSVDLIADIDAALAGQEVAHA